MAFWILYSLDDRLVDPEVDSEKEGSQDDLRSHTDDAEISRVSSTVSVGQDPSSAFFTLCQKVRRCIAKEASEHAPSNSLPCPLPSLVGKEGWAPEDEGELDGTDRLPMALPWVLPRRAGEKAGK